jgi:hypothetical protein
MPRNKIRIEQGETKALVADSDPMGDYEVIVNDNRLLVDDRKADANEGRLVEKGRPAKFTKDKRTEAIFGFAPAGPVTVEIAKTRFSILKLPPMTLEGNRQNADSITQQTVTTSSTSAEALPRIDVPDGFDTLITPLSGNTGDVFIGDATTQSVIISKPGDTFTTAVSDTSEVFIQTPTAGDGVALTVEVN